VRYYRRFIKDFGAIAVPLTQLLRKDAFLWCEEAATAFDALKAALSSAPVLHLPDFEHEFVVDCDASGSGFGAVLHQGAGPLAFFSRPFVVRHLKVAAYERELIGLVHVVRHWLAISVGVSVLGAHGPLCIEIYARSALVHGSATSMDLEALRFRFSG
jgi:hypothetical protein